MHTYLYSLPIPTYIYIYIPLKPSHYIPTSKQQPKQKNENQTPAIKSSSPVSENPLYTSHTRHASPGNGAAAVFFFSNRAITRRRDARAFT